MAWRRWLKARSAGAAIIHSVVHALSVSSAVDGMVSGAAAVSANVGATDNVAAFARLAEVRLGSALVLSTEP